ncbi:SagB family peptide dehydrogenase [Mycobacterium sp. TY815]|uniref:SagB family peptide dehydrogenase n=1 Tax=Mycobacterium sp. TY815 TaxID=3050581 RepID=UPI002740A0B2|nr:SagB family peptide dehydrogenase [Mycobacterium sp. TY815]MDP7707266.1 SagB family peptide dehydrogenase [Mycobacterium sp. TY815]
MFASRYPGHTRFAFRSGVTCLTTGAGAVLLKPPHSEKLARLTPQQTKALKYLNAGPGSVTELAEGAAPADTRGIEALIDHLATRGYLTVTVCDEGTDLYSIVPFGQPPARPAPMPDGSVMSKFSVLHSDSDGLVLENPLGWCDVRIHQPRLLPLLGGRASDCPDLPATVAAQFVDDLRWAGVLVGPEEETSSFEALSWAAPDLWFHRRSTLGQRTLTWDDFGPTKWAKGRFAQPPGRRRAYPGEPVALPVPDLAARRSQDPPLAAVIEDRVTTRSFDDERPITAAQLGELLYRTARTRATQAVDAGEELLSRPYPSGGGLYELEVYPVVRSVAGLEPGVYHYDSFDHALHRVAAADAPATSQLIRPAAATLSGGAEPQVLLVIAARGGRLMWTYEQIAYATILKNVGVLMQTIYLAATAMGLGVCAQGFSDTAAFTAATGVDERQECSVGSIIVGSRIP